MFKIKPRRFKNHRAKFEISKTILIYAKRPELSIKFNYPNCRIAQLLKSVYVDTLFIYEKCFYPSISIKVYLLNFKNQSFSSFVASLQQACSKPVPNLLIHTSCKKSIIHFNCTSILNMSIYFNTNFFHNIIILIFGTMIPRTIRKVVLTFNHNQLRKMQVCCLIIF